MITWILRTADQDPSYIIGAMCHNLETNAQIGTGPCVAEVDESDGSLVNTAPEHVVLNNLELDHLNYYPSWDKLLDTMRAFFVDNPRRKRAFVNFDDVGVRRLIEAIPEVSVTGFGLTHADAEYRGSDVVTEGMISTFRVDHRETALGEITLRVPGLYNVHNALGAIACTHAMGVDFDTIREALGTFQGLENRFTLVDTGSVQVVKDYISHPTGIQRVLEAARSISRGKLHAVFKPYRFTMIHYLQDEYRDCFQEADHTVVTEMYTAGEVPIAGVDTEFLCRKIRESGSTVTHVPEMDAIVDHLQETVASDGMVIFLGGDDLFRLADDYIAQLRKAGDA
jgi:UDP-N-acetylmuramate--alanine ligase